MSKIRLFLDEDVWPGLAAALREHGFDALHVYDVGREGLSDFDQLAYAVQQRRALVTHNSKDFVPLATTYFFDERPHFGIILARQIEKGELVKRTLALLNALSVEELADTVRHLASYE